MTATGTNTRRMHATTARRAGAFLPSDAPSRRTCAAVRERLAALEHDFHGAAAAARSPRTVSVRRRPPAVSIAAWLLLALWIAAFAVQRLA